MGFPDERRNMQVLRGLDGNVEKSVETLIRLGEGSKSSSRAHSPLPPSPLADIGFSNGLTVDKTRITPRADKSNNPFDINVHKSLPPPPAQGQTVQRGLFMERTVSPTITSNPFLQPGQQQMPLDQSFQNMQISQQQQQQPQSPQDQLFQAPQNPQNFQQQQGATPQLFPNTTGGYSASQAPTNPFLQTFTSPPIPQIPTQYQQFTQPSPFQPPQQNYNQPQSTGQAPNPFLRTSRSQIFNPTNSFDQASPFGVNNTQQSPPQNMAQQQQQPVQISALQPQSHYNPFQPNQPQQQQNQPVLSTSPIQQGQSFSPFQQPQSSSPFQSMTASQPQQQVMYQEPQSMPQPNSMPFQLFASPASAPPQQQQIFQPPPFNPLQQQQHQATYPPIRQDKNSILALYNYPQATPAPTGVNGHQGGVQLQAPTTINGQRRSVTMPVSSLTSGGNMNPFAPNGTTNGNTGLGGGGNVNGMNGISTNGLSPAATNGYRHVSNESVQFGADMMMNGRHSPDAFAGLSARLR
jgi:hypothetical protein